MLAAAAVVALAAGCATQPAVTPPARQVPMVLVPAALAAVDDHRAAFRRLYCALHGRSARADASLPPCDQSLVPVGVEPAGNAVADIDADRAPGVRVAVVLGLGWECLRGLVDVDRLPMRHLARLGYPVEEIHVDGLSSSARNAREIRDALVADVGGTDGRQLVLVGYSKGVVDILEAVAGYPEVAERVAAVVSVAGAVGGSPLADTAGSGALALFRAVPGAHCGGGDGGAMDSLRPWERRAWLAGHRLPGGVRYYSLVTYPQADSVSAVLLPGHRTLSAMADRNDGSLLPHDQLIPGGVLLGYVNADHWAVALPVAESSPLLGATLVNHNRFPRDPLWEALIRYVDWDLARDTAGP